jgi:Gas vesicle protein
MSSEGERLPTQREVSLVEILDRALGAGVVITGDITLSLADVDLVYLSLRLVVGSVPTLYGELPDEGGSEVLSLAPAGGDAR